MTPGSPWENGKNESVNGKFRIEFLDRQPPLTLKGLRIHAAWWRKYYNEERPHSALDYRSPAEFARTACTHMACWARNGSAKSA